MYGFQGNNSQTYDYQNPNGSSFGNMGQYTGPYHSYYSNTTAAYSTFPSNDQPCSSLGVLPQEYSQVGNGMPRPYFYDTNTSYSRPYQGLPFSQSVEIPIASSFNACPRNCHCCESLKPKFFTPSNTIHQQANSQSTCNSAINASYNGLRKGFDAGLWRDCNNQLPNIHKSNDSWSLPKYGSSCKSEPCPWPLSQRQSGKYESGEHLSSSVNSKYILSQQNQRKSLPNGQSYSSVHANSLLPVQATCRSPGRNEDILGTCRVGYQYNSFSDLPKSNVEPRPYLKPTVNPIQTSSRPNCNIPSTCGGGFPYRFSSPGSKSIHESPKYVMDTPKVVTQFPSAVVDSFQRHLPSSSLLDGTKEMPYCQPGMMSSVISMDSQPIRAFNISNEGDSRFLLNCNSSVSNDVLPTSRLQLPPIQSFKSTSVAVRNSSREFHSHLAHVSPKSMPKNQHNDGFGICDNRSNSFSTDASGRNFPIINPDGFCPSTSSENLYKIPPRDENNCILTTYLANNQYEEKHVKVKLAYSDVLETDSKHEPSKDVPTKHLSSGNSSVMGDLRHFLSTWDDGDEEDTQSMAQSVLSPNNKNGLEPCVEEYNPPNEFFSPEKPKEKSTSNSKVTSKNVSMSDYKIVQSHQEFSHALESSNFEQSYVDVDILNGNEGIVHELSIAQETSKEIHDNMEPIINEIDADFEISSNENICSNISKIDNIEGCSDMCPTLEENTGNSAVSMENLDSSVENFFMRKKSSDTGHNKKAGELYHSSETPPSQVASSDPITCRPSHCEIKDEQSKLQSCIHATVDDIPTDWKIISRRVDGSEEQMTECVNLESQDMASGERGMEGTAISPEGRLIKSNSLPKSGNASVDSDKMIFYNVTTRVNVLLERLEVSPDSVYGRNEDIQNGLIEKNHPKSVQELAHQNNLNDIKISLIDKLKKSLKENEVSSFLGDNGEVEVLPLLSGNTDPSPPVTKEKSLNHMEDTRKEASKNTLAHLPNKNGIDYRCLKGCQEEYDSIQEDIRNMERVQISSLNKLQRMADKCETAGSKILEAHAEVSREIGNDKLSKIQENVEEKDNFDSELAGVSYKDEKNILSVYGFEDLKKKVTDNGSKELAHKFEHSETVKGPYSKNLSKRFMNSSVKLKSLNCKNPFKNGNMNFVNKFIKKARCKAVSIRKKYHMQEVRNRIKVKVGMCSGAGNKWKLIKKCRKIKNRASEIVSKETSIAKKLNIEENSNVENDCGVKNDCSLDDASKFYLENGESGGRYEGENEELMKSSTVIKEDNLLTLNSLSFLKKVKSLGEKNSFEYLDGDNAVELSNEKNIEPALFSEEEREIHLENLAGNCVIGNVEVFMGTVEEGSSLEEEAKEASFDCEIPVEGELLGQDTIGVQYWNSFELGNALGVAMEVEVGSEIDCENDLTLLQPIETESSHVTTTKTNAGSTFSQEDTISQSKSEVLVTQTEELEEIGDKKLNAGNRDKSLLYEDKEVKEKNENGCIKTDMQPEIINTSKNEGNYVKNSNDLKSSNIFPENDNHLEHVVQIKPSTSYDAIVMKDDSHVKQSGVDIQYTELAASSKNCSSYKIEKGMKEDLRIVSPMQNVDCVAIENNCTYQDCDLEAIYQKTSHPKICKKSKSSSIVLKPKKFQKKFKRHKKIVSNNNKAEPGLESSELLTHQPNCETKTKDKGGLSLHHLTSGNGKIGSMELNKSDCRKSLSHTKEINDASLGNHLLINDHKNEMSEDPEKKSENNHLYPIKPEYDENCKKIKRIKILKGGEKQIEVTNDSQSLLKECMVKEKEWDKQKNDLKLKSKVSFKNFDNLQLHSVKSSRTGFWRNRTWHFNKKYNKHHMAIRKPSKCSNVSKLSTYGLSNILKSSPTPPPPLLSPLSVLNDSVANSVSHCHSVSSSNISHLDFSKLSSPDASMLDPNHSSLTVKQYSSEPTGVIVMPKKFDTSSNNMYEDSNLVCSPSSVLSHPNTSANPELFSKSPASKLLLSQNNDISCLTKISESKTKIKSDNPSSVEPMKILPNDSHSLEMIDSSVVSSSSSQDLSLNFACSSQNVPPRVCITFKKVGIVDNKERWIKSPIQEGVSYKRDDIIKGESKRNKTCSTSEHESPLPKVTIKKKTGEKGYQSFLSGFSSSSPSPSSSPVTSAPPLSASEKAEISCLETYDELMEKNINEDSINTETFQTVSSLKVVISSNGIQESSVPNENAVSDTQREADFVTDGNLNSGIVEKKEGSGLVFVIRGLANKVRKYSSKEVLLEQKLRSPEKTPHTTEKRNVVNSECSVSSGDDGWESGPWSVWQPVVKLSRSCELDALARELHSMDEDDESKADSECFQSWRKSIKVQGSSIKPHEDNESQFNKVLHSPSLLVKDEIRSDTPGVKKLSNKKRENGDCEMKLKRRISNEKVEKDKLKGGIIKSERKSLQLHQEEKRQKHITTSSDLMKKVTPQKNINPIDTLKKREQIKGKKSENDGDNVCADFKIRKKQANLLGKGSLGSSEEKYFERGEFSSTPSKKMNIDKRLWKKRELTKFDRSEKRGGVNISMIKKENVVDCIKESTIIQKKSSSKEISKEEVKFDNALSVSLPLKIKEEKEDPCENKDIGVSKASSLPNFQKRSLSKEKSTHRIHSLGKERSHGAYTKDNGRHSFQCEACSRKFPSQKWLTRHCKGASHSRVENAQRIAVQALLLLLTGDESKLLQPLTEKELYHLKNWPSRALPSPLQLALKEFLHPA